MTAAIALPTARRAPVYLLMRTRTRKPPEIS